MDDNGAVEPPAQMRHPRVADLLADTLRSRILSGELPDGTLLPKQSALLEEFGVSKLAAREALRILETEGLITIRRGKAGGSVVHAPKRDSVAYMLALVLESRQAALPDVGFALQQIEPFCASLCAQRPDRHTAVVPELRRAHESLVEAIETGDEKRAVPASREFHEAIVRLCGNETLFVVAGALETLWTAQESDWSELATTAGFFPEPALRRQALQEHAEALALIEAGDADGVARLLRSHLQTAQQYPMTGVSPDQRVQATLLRPVQPTEGA
ncbi:FadR/GntR family transcriptional regulator [Actinomadura verrucosospora]|uniref:GntR family transcriptional regulator n=1 Tax=Actinomadura verrucosospora TaxID=46165 RepID=A0A7D3VUI6_ACTVE|nr:FCD domain-containing protein [Actinomadura verrucosospora]QKG19152.1 GntR family transcriptional regulator [Actinomadura verrucosospora]